MFTFEQIYRAYRDCRKNKRNTRDALIFECNQEENIVQLVDALNSHSYQPVTSACFYIKKILLDFSFLNRYFYVHYHKLYRKYRCPRYVHTLKQQVSYYTKIFPGSLLLVQVGCYYESYNKQAEQLSAATGYQIRKSHRRFWRACGFHQRFLDRVCKKLETNKISYVVIVQSGKYLNATMERVPQFMVKFTNKKLAKEAHS